MLVLDRVIINRLVYFNLQEFLLAGSWWTFVVIDRPFDAMYLIAARSMVHIRSLQMFPPNSSMKWHKPTTSWIGWTVPGTKGTRPSSQVLRSQGWPEGKWMVLWFWCPAQPYWSVSCPGRSALWGSLMETVWNILGEKSTAALDGEKKKHIRIFRCYVGIIQLWGCGRWFQIPWNTPNYKLMTLAARITFGFVMLIFFRIDSCKSSGIQAPQTWISVMEWRVKPAKPE